MRKEQDGSKNLSTFASHPEGPASNPSWDLYFWSVHVLLVHKWVFCGSLPQCPFNGLLTQPGCTPPSPNSSKDRPQQPHNPKRDQAGELSQQQRCSKTSPVLTSLGPALKPSLTLGHHRTNHRPWQGPALRDDVGPPPAGELKRCIVVWVVARWSNPHQKTTRREFHISTSNWNLAIFHSNKCLG